jgi:hypothetical protein
MPMPRAHRMLGASANQSPGQGQASAAPHAAKWPLCPTGPGRDTSQYGTALGDETYDRDGVVVNYWLGTTSWRRLDPGKMARVEDVLTADPPDPAELHKIDWELAAYWCRSCQVCYCRDDWQKTIVWYGPFYDYTDGVCPAGHRYMIDD